MFISEFRFSYILLGYILAILLAPLHASVDIIQPQFEQTYFCADGDEADTISDENETVEESEEDLDDEPDCD